MDLDARIRRRGGKLAAFALAGMLAAALAPVAEAQRQRASQAPRTRAAERLVEERSGTIATREGRRLRLVTDVGNVRVHTHDAPQVTYRVRLEAQGAQPGAQELIQQFVVSARGNGEGVEIRGRVPWRNFRGRLWVNFDVEVPRNYHLEITSAAGGIEVGDINGKVVLVTEGGNITVGSAGGPARLETRGGHVKIARVAGDLTAVTAGGHVEAGEVAGNAVLRSGGGHVRARQIGGTAELETGGGNIALDRAGGTVSATTAGGRIDFGEASGVIRARTGGGGIRVHRVLGRTELETAGGSVHLMRVGSGVRASTLAGNITAWFVSGADLAGGAQLVCGQGDIVVYLPRNLRVKIEAAIEQAGDHRVLADPDLPLKLSYAPAGAGLRTLRAEGELNGGGQLLQLRTVGGNIQLKYADSLAPTPVMPPTPPMPPMPDIARELEQAQRQIERQRRQAERLAEQQARESSRLADFQRRLAERLWGRTRVDPQEQMKRLVHSVRPAYPDLAMRERIHGLVRLDVFIDREGNVEDVRVLSGHRLLARAAEAAVRQWRYKPAEIDGKAIPVVTTVVMEFKLN